MNTFRIEKDTLGEVRVPSGAYWGAQTQRAVENFPISGMRLPPVFIRALVTIKLACADANAELGILNPGTAEAIKKVCRELLDGKFSDQFPLDIFQTGSGTSTNMNVNEVIATRANEILTGAMHSSSPVHPNDDVNNGQSSNDVIPSAITIAAALQTRDLLIPALALLSRTIASKMEKYHAVVKTGRTHLMDAVPMTVEQEMSGWEAQVEMSKQAVESALSHLSELAIGGTAIGTGLNTRADFGGRVAAKITSLTGMEFRETSNHFEAQAMQNGVAGLSGQLRFAAENLMKISNDLRLMNSGPMAGLAEIRLPSLQPGSSIMPGKVNPVVPEAVRMVALRVIGNDTVIALSNALGEFQLNVMLPLIASSIIESVTILGNVTKLLAEKCIAGMEVNEVRLAAVADKNPIIATVLNPIIGYDRASEVVKEALREDKSVKQIAVEKRYLTAEKADELLDPALITHPGTENKNGTGGG